MRTAVSTLNSSSLNPLQVFQHLENLQEEGALLPHQKSLSAIEKREVQNISVMLSCSNCIYTRNQAILKGYSP